jgi:cytochrome c biogenesis protein CcmG/thiol:disulfide interchange protein DsbE
LLVQEVVAQYRGKAAFVSENFGASKLAEKFGVTRYPAVFVDDVLVARPRDFGFYGTGESAGRYTPWRNAESQAKFKADLTRMVDLVLAGKKAQVAKEHSAPVASDQIAEIPKFKLTDLAGRELTERDLAGRAVVVEFWATWCPPCRSTLEWLGQLKQKYGDNVAVLALAVESPEEGVKSEAGSLSTEIHWAISDAQTAQAFGDVVAVPTMYLFDRDGKTVKVLYGAPPNLHEEAEKTLESLVQ